MIRIVSYDARTFFTTTVAKCNAAVEEYRVEHVERMSHLLSLGTNLLDKLNSKKAIKSRRDQLIQLTDRMATLKKLADENEPLKKACTMVLEHPDAWERSKTRPVTLSCDETIGNALFEAQPDSRLFLYKNAIIDVRGPYDKVMAKTIAKDFIDRKINKAESLGIRDDIQDGNFIDYERRAIPQEVRTAVWTRDRGRCTQCQSVHNLEFDHIIPVSKGGANTTRNIQLLCMECNRAKSDSI